MKLFILEVFMFHHIAQMLPPSESFELSLGDYKPTKYGVYSKMSTLLSFYGM